MWENDINKSISNNELEQNRNIIWIAKGIAVIAIVACHCCHVNENASFLNEVSYAIMNFWMRLGVPVFYFFAGYFMKNDGSYIEFWKKKTITIIVPWIVTGTMVWLYIVLRKGGLTLAGWFNYVLLRKSYLYFLTDLITFYLLTWCVRGKKAIRIALGVLIVLLMINGVYTLKMVGFLGKYISLFNYVIFLTGKAVGDTGNLFCKNDKVGVIGIFVWVILHFWEVNILHDANVSVSIVISLLGISSIIFIAKWMCKTRIGDVLNNLGKASFSIYLLHMPVAGVIANLLNRSEWFAPLTIFRPIIVIFITMFFIRLYLRLFPKNVFKVLIGYRG